MALSPLIANRRGGQGSIWKQRTDWLPIVDGLFWDSFDSSQTLRNLPRLEFCARLHAPVVEAFKFPLHHLLVGVARDDKIKVSSCPLLVLVNLVIVLQRLPPLLQLRHPHLLMMMLLSSQPHIHCSHCRQTFVQPIDQPPLASSCFGSQNL
jgi:hypothetical protein